LAAGVFRPAGDEHAVLRRDPVQPLRAVLADHLHRGPATRAGYVLRFDDDLDARQMFGQRAALGPPLCRPGAAQCRIGFLLLGLGFGNRLLKVLQRKVELVGVEPLRAPTELQALQLASWSRSATSCTFSACSASRSAHAATSIARSAATSSGSASGAEFMTRLDHGNSGL
jgi:hypothetical protein